MTTPEGNKLFKFVETNSEGYFVLKESHYEKLTEAGWSINFHLRCAFGNFNSEEEAEKSWEEATGLDLWDYGPCPCCGPRFDFKEFEGDQTVKIPPHIRDGQFGGICG